jgi:hypothetical protein
VGQRREEREGATLLAAPFEIVAMDDESHSRLRIALESLLNQTTVGLRFSKRRSLWFNS